jgi:hypothetical protein
MRISLILATVSLVSVAMSAQTTEKPDLTGKWQLDAERTRFGKLPQPKDLVIQIEHQEPQIRLITLMNNGAVRETLELTTDGKQYPHPVQGKECMASAAWDEWTGTRLRVEVNCPGSSSTRRFAAGTKGKILTTVLTVKDRSGEKKAYEFFFRE